jgi:rhodanese-related sulfurtransferase
MHPEVSVSQLADINDPILIDVREVDEFIAGHVPGAVNIPLSALTERFGEIPQVSEVHVICQAGGRSLRACEFLSQQQIFTDATFINVGGGTGMWIVEGHEVVVGE